MYFLRAVFRFLFIACIQIKRFSERFIFPHLSNLPRSDFPGSHGAKTHYWLLCFEHALQSSLFFSIFFYGVWKPCKKPETSGDWTHKYHKTALLFITRFLYWTFLYLLLLITLSYREFFPLFVLTYFDSSRRHTHATTHATVKQIVRAKMTSLDAIFCRGNRSSSRSLHG